MTASKYVSKLPCISEPVRPTRASFSYLFLASRRDCSIVAESNWLVKSAGGNASFSLGDTRPNTGIDPVKPLELETSVLFGFVWSLNFSRLSLVIGTMAISPHFLRSRAEL